MLCQPDTGDEVTSATGSEEEPVRLDEVAGHGDRFLVRYTVGVVYQVLTYLKVAGQLRM
jgi:hypothetical protein